MKKGGWSDAAGHGAAANLDAELGIRFAQFEWNVANCDGPFDAGREGATVDLADAAILDDRVAGSGHAPALEHETDQTPLDSRALLRLERGLADETRAEVQEVPKVGLERRVFEVQFVTVERVGHLGAQRVARAESGKAERVAARFDQASQTPRAASLGVQISYPSSPV